MSRNSRNYEEPERVKPIWTQLCVGWGEPATAEEVNEILAEVLERQNLEVFRTNRNGEDSFTRLEIREAEWDSDASE